jgi:aryl-alcohol dehydrogenase-like predicted oxidoreductase
MPVFAWSSLGRGFLSGRFSRRVYEEEGDKLDSSFVRAFCFEENFQRLERAEVLAKEKGVTIPQIALAYVLNQPLEIYALVGAETPEEFSGCCKSLDIELSSGELAWLNLESDAR